MEALVAPPLVDIDTKELIKLCGIDSELYGRVFFPRTFRHDAPSFAKPLWRILEHPNVRLANILVFRGGSKTTRLRVFASKRISYGISRTILVIGSREEDAIRSVNWIKLQVERNTFWTSTFGIRRGSKWEETLIEIVHEGFGHSVWVTAAGIHGSLRGMNFDDYRPDLIILDDPQTDEMAATSDQREKTENLILTAVKNSLAPPADEPNAKLVMLATPIARGDVTQKASADEEWETFKIPCWTPETLLLPVDEQISCWENRFPTHDLRREKRLALKRNKLSLFAREKEVRLISSETSEFRREWLRIRTEPAIVHRGCFAVLAIDPVPPPSDREVATGLKTKDFEVHQVWGRVNGAYHLLESRRNRGHDPSWSVATALELAHRWRVARLVVEMTAYQRTLEWHLRQAMTRRRVYYAIVPTKNPYKTKYAKIVGVYNGLGSAGLIWIGPEHTEFAAQWEAYASVDHDDDLDCGAMALIDIANPWLETESGAAGELDDSAVESFPLVRACP